MYLVNWHHTEDSTCLLFLLDFYIIGFLPSIWMMMMCGSKILSSSSELSWAYVCSKLQLQNETHCTAYYLQLVFTSGFGAIWRDFGALLLLTIFMVYFLWKSKFWLV